MDNGVDNDYGVSKKTPPAKVAWYLSTPTRFKTLFENVNDANNIRWCVDGRKCDGKNFHVADSC